MVCTARLERATSGPQGRCYYQLSYVQMKLEQYAKENLLMLVDEYQRVTGIKDGALSKIIYGKSDFIVTSLRERSRSFTLRKYDEMVEAFEVMWPKNAVWPFSRLIE
jgi:hypothetical protein